MHQAGKNNPLSTSNRNNETFGNRNCLLNVLFLYHRRCFYDSTHARFLRFYDFICVLYIFKKLLYLYR